MMKHIFITYGDAGFEAAKERIVREAERTGEFDRVYAYGREDLSKELLDSAIIKIGRGGGLWSWKPDIILSTMERAQESDVIVYCDAGCSLSPCREWKRYWQIMENHDILAQRIFQRTDKWTRKELLDMFSSNGKSWPLCYQFQATPMFKVSDFSKKFVREWRDLMISDSKLAMDVEPEERVNQHPALIENRHDQAIFSSLVYKYLAFESTKEKIYTQWERLEDCDPFRRQAIRTTRLRQGEEESSRHKRRAIPKRIIKHYLFKPFFYAPLQWWYGR